MGKEQPGEHNPQAQYEHKVARALSILEHNRALKAIAEGRIEKAESRVRSYLLLYGFTSARLAGFQIELDGDELHLTRLPIEEDAEQLAFWLSETAPDTEEAGRQPQEPPTPHQVELISQANTSELPCPICGERLKARLTHLEEDTDGMLLYCACGFKEV
jgi:predicted RNA-binding Zn-ribbon protein involved in translation (DUF1610 family)